jgi:hypothetical protein
MVSHLEIDVTYELLSMSKSKLMSECGHVFPYVAMTLAMYIASWQQRPKFVT